METPATAKNSEKQLQRFQREVWDDQKERGGGGGGGGDGGGGEEKAFLPRSLMAQHLC